MNWIVDFFKRLVGLSSMREKVSFRKTMLVNFRVCGWTGLWIRPILIYKNTNIYRIGTILITSPLKKGLVKIGCASFKSNGVTKLNNSGTITIDGPLVIGGSSIIDNKGNIHFKGYNVLGDGCTLIIREGLEVGYQSRIGFHSHVMDTDDHFVVDVEKRTVTTNTKRIVLGDFNWLGHNCYVKKGVRTADYLTVAAPNTLLTKDYSDLPPYSVLAGSPAKLLKTGIRRVLNHVNERNLYMHFKNTREDFVVEDSEDLDMYCSMQ